MANNKVLEALKALANKIEEIENHPSFQCMVAISSNHGFPYSGPDWGDELKTAKKVIEEASDE